MKSIWNGSIAFGLVNIPIVVYSATESSALGFTLLHEKCKTPLKYHRWCPKCKKEVKWDQTVKGLKKANGHYLILTQEALKELRPEKTDEITIVECVAMDQIEVIYLNNHYYVAPTSKHEHAYALFMQALEQLGKVAVGRFVMRDKQYTCILQPYKNYLLLTTLHYAYEIRGIEKLAFTKKVRLAPKELSLAKEFIKKISVKKFNIKQFKDTFAQEIRALLKRKTTKKIRTTRKATKKRSSLMESLKANVAKQYHPASRPAARAKKKKR